jgi:hypothetical protein
MDMEELKNCEIIMEIEHIENITGSDQLYEIVVLSKDGIKYRIIFDHVWDMRCAIENAYIDRFSKFVHKAEKRSDVLIIENSDYIKYFEKQVSGTRPTEKINNYILVDCIDTIVEILTISKPKVSKI